MTPPVLTPRQAFAAIRSMKIRGAASIGLNAARSLAEHVQGLQGTPAQVWQRTLTAARLLDSARPTAVSLHNCLGWILAGVKPEATVAGQKRAARETERLVADEVKTSREAIARHGARHVKDGDVVLTHCNSSTVVAILREAKNEGRVVEVIATETRPFRQGIITVTALRTAGLECALVVDSAVDHVLSTRDVDLVLVGADAVTADGSLYNKIGTAGVAALAGLHDVPFYAAAGLHKFSVKREVPIEHRSAKEIIKPGEVPRGVRVLNPVFDRTPPNRIDGYVTERGLESPAKAVQRNLRTLPPEGVWA